MMSWLEEFKEDIIALHRVRSRLFGRDLDKLFDDPETMDQKLDELFNETKEDFALLLDGTLDPGDLEAIAESFWTRHQAALITASKQEVAIHNRLETLYKRLAGAPEEDWAAYTKMCVFARFKGESAMWRWFAETLKSENEIDESNEVLN